MKKTRSADVSLCLDYKFVLQEEVFVPERIVRPLFGVRLVALRRVVHLDDDVYVMATPLGSDVVRLDHFDQKFLVLS